ncbi:RHS repeat-associated core domain-containing protein [Rheinheimera sp.]|uniref:RHS repeat-associated core domain-containing protein n=1 Tax=Rheinheimera sp. TaxID=1869214 RepID=UPI002733CC69|nr:RHS repeat-associated core domain-containing protein [Rheinheimera sp.]MDP2713463.1 RHS repeat-associated core domain-containing protein [Rheinheimera sp.]
MASLEIKNTFGTVVCFSQTAAEAKGTVQTFVSAVQAEEFLRSNFPAFNSSFGNLAQVHALHSGKTQHSNAKSAKDQVYRALAEAIAKGELLLSMKQARQVEVVSAGSASQAARSDTKAAKRGGGSEQPATDEIQTAAANNSAGSNGADKIVPPNSDVAFEGDPVAMCSGEEVLELTDFSLPGPLPLQFKRTYRSGQSHENIGFGFGWRSNFHLQIVAEQNAEGVLQLVLHNEEGRRLNFSPVASGHTSYQLSESLALRHEENGSQVLLRPDNTHWVFVPVKVDAKQPQRWALHQIFDSLGNYLQLYYDRFSRLSRIDYTRKRGIELHYNAAGLLSRIDAVEQTTDGLKALDVILAQYQYDDQRDLTAATNHAGQTEHYAYQGHLLTQRQRASGFKHYFSWQGEGPAARCSRNWGDDGYYDYKFDYDDSQRLAISTDSRGQRWQYFHNERNQLIKKVAPDGATWLYSWNAQGKKSAETAPDGSVARYYFNDVGQLITVEQADGAISHFQYNELGQRTGFTDAEGHHWLREYSAGGLLKSETRPDGSISRYQYNQDGQLTQLQHADGRTEHYLWNDEGQLLARKQGEAVSRFSYDKLGRLNGVVDAAGLVTEYQRDSSGNITSQRSYASGEPEQAVTEQFSYDAAGRLTGRQNALAQRTQWQYEGLSQPVKQLQADGSALNYQYDKERNLTAIMRSDGARYQLDYDGQERPVKLQGFDGRVQQYQYDINGKVSALSDGSKRQLRLKRDSRGRIIEQTALFGQQLASNHFHYDKLGRPLRASNAQRKLRFSYHANGQLSEQWQDDWRTLHHYDAAGRRQCTVLPDGSTLDYRYNDQGLLSQLALNQQPLLWRSFDAAGRETAREYSSGLQLKQQFDAFNRLTAQQWQHNTDDSTAQQQRQYHYSGLHQLLKVTDNQKGDTEYQYNNLDQLISKSHSSDNGQSEQLQWDSFGNPAGDAVEVKQDRLLRYHDNQYQYDDSGNQFSATAPGKRQQREFNGFNQLTALSCGKANSGNSVTRYEYDAFGRRSAKITGDGRTDFLWDGNSLIGEYCQGEFSWYIYEPNSNKPLALVKQGRVYFYQFDQLGTPLSLTDSENNIVWQAHYSVFGKATVTVNKIDNPIRFQGQYFDNESGLHYNHFRYYDPQTGRFISQDPIGLLGGINHYQYAPNHINWIDPLGLCAKEEGSVGLLDGIVGTADLVVTGLVNTGVDIVAGGAGLVTLAISGGNVDAAAHTIESVQEKQIGLLSQAGEKVAGVVAPAVDKYYEQNMAALGDATLEATGSPMLATAAHKSVELVGTVLGAGVVGKSLKNGAKVDGVGVRSEVPNKVDDVGSTLQGAVIKPKEPKILSDSSLSVDELKFLQREFLIKKRAIERAANRGELVWSPNTADTRISSLQQAYRDAVKERYIRRFGVEPDLSKLNADHPVDLVIGGSATQRLKLLNESINKSVGSSLLQAGRKANLNPGDVIKYVEFQKR